MNVSCCLMTVLLVLSSSEQAFGQEKRPAGDKFEKMETAARLLESREKDPGEFELVSLSRHSNPTNRITMFDMTGKYKAHYAKVLRNKTYWLACFQVRRPSVGAERCYFIDDKTEKLIEIHRGK